VRNKAPDVFAMIDRMMVGPEPLNTTLGWAIQNGVEDWERAAICYLQNYGDRCRTRVTSDAYDRISAALERSG
jgi:hypothetical protein